jgi:hypothetical protein
VTGDPRPDLVAVENWSGPFIVLGAGAAVLHVEVESYPDRSVRGSVPVSDTTPWSAETHTH